MSVFYNRDFGNCKTALDIITNFPKQAGQDGYYMVWPQGRNSTGQIVWCDMTTDGGGYMLIARSHPTTILYNGKSWGWQGGSIGSIKDFTQSYQSGWWDNWHKNGATFTSFIFGNRANINNNLWGSFIFKVTPSSGYTTFITSDTQQTASVASCLKSNTSVYGSSTFSGMQGAIGYPVSGTSANNYYMRDCCGYAGFGGTPTSFSTTYCNSDVNVYYSGPWCGGSSTDANGNFIDNPSTTAGGHTYGGTNQYMIMVR